MAVEDAGVALGVINAAGAAFAGRHIEALSRANAVKDEATGAALKSLFADAEQCEFAEFTLHFLQKSDRKKVVARFGGP